ncbi:hypothetical protein D3C85_1806680 [compost metagenome]
MRLLAVGQLSSVVRATMASTTVKSDPLASQVRPISVRQGRTSLAKRATGLIHSSVMRTICARRAVSSAATSMRLGS